MMKKYYLLIPVLLLVIGGVFLYLHAPQQSEQVYDNAKVELFSVKIDGQVAFPGTYKCLSGTTVETVIGYAGGYLPTADQSSLNEGEVINGAMTIHVLAVEKAETVKVNLNTASFEQLLTVPYINDQKAASIIIYREQHGKFKSVEEIVNVKYIGNATYEKIKNYLCV
jgi:competence protein ComEA